MKKRNLLDSVIYFFDKLEDKIRGYLSHHPILYTFVGGFAVVLFWRGVWHTADMVPFLTGPISIIISVIVLLLTGLFVSVFVGDMIIMSGLKKDKKVIDKTEEDIQKEKETMKSFDEKLTQIEKTLEKIENNSLKP
jgi:hypothetical protein